MLEKKSCTVLITLAWWVRIFLVRANTYLVVDIYSTFDMQIANRKEEGIE